MYRKTRREARNLLEPVSNMWYVNRRQKHYRKAMVRMDMLQTGIASLDRKISGGKSWRLRGPAESRESGDVTKCSPWSLSDFVEVLTGTHAGVNDVLQKL